MYCTRCGARNRSKKLAVHSIVGEKGQKKEAGWLRKLDPVAEVAAMIV
jgi:hypothetical protein